MKNKKKKIISIAISIALIISGIGVYYKTYTDSHLTNEKYSEIKMEIDDMINSYDRYETESNYVLKDIKESSAVAVAGTAYNMYDKFSDSEQNKIKKYYAKTYNRKIRSEIASMIELEYSTGHEYMDCKAYIADFKDFSSLDVIS